MHRNRFEKRGLRVARCPETDADRFLWINRRTLPDATSTCKTILDALDAEVG